MDKSSQLFVSVIAGLVIIILVALITNRDSLFKINQKTFLIIGPTFSGKTSLFQLLTTSNLPKYAPVLSQEPNEVLNYRLPAGEGIKDSFLLREYPGHSKLLNLYLYKDLKDKQFLKNVKGIIIVIDSSNIKEFETTRMLYEVLSHTEFFPNGVDILIACNKQDLFQSKPVFKIREILELEMNKLKQNFLKNLDKVDINEDDQLNSNESFMTNLGDKFTFDQLEGNFDFAEGSVLKKKIDKWECWISERAVN